MQETEKLGIAIPKMIDAIKNSDGLMESLTSKEEIMRLADKFFQSLKLPLLKRQYVFSI